MKLFLSLVNMIEVWDKKRYEEAVSDTLQSFGDLAEEVMGNQPKQTQDGIS